MSVARFQVAARKKRCPVCARPSRKAYRPFCSARCADIDLGRWLEGRYRIPTDEAPEERDAPGEDDAPADGAGAAEADEDEAF